METSVCLKIARVTRSPPALFSASRLGIPTSTKTSFLSIVRLLSRNPRVSLETLTVKDISEDLASAYLSVLPNHEQERIANGHEEEMIFVPTPGG